MNAEARPSVRSGLKYPDREVSFGLGQHFSRAAPWVTWAQGMSAGASDPAAVLAVAQSCQVSRQPPLAAPLQRARELAR